MLAKLKLAVAGFAVVAAGSACAKEEAEGEKRRAEEMKEAMAIGCDRAAPECLPEDVVLTDTMSDEMYPPEALKGKVVVINFWATYCAPCKKEIPAFNRVFTEYAPKGVHMFGILQDPEVDSDAELLNFASDFEMTYPIVWMDNAVARGFGVAGAIPTTWIYAKNGRRVVTKVGPMSERELRGHLDKLL